MCSWAHRSGPLICIGPTSQEVQTPKKGISAMNTLGAKLTPFIAFVLQTIEVFMLLQYL